MGPSLQLVSKSPTCLQISNLYSKRPSLQLVSKTPTCLQNDQVSNLSPNLQLVFKTTKPSLMLNNVDQLRLYFTIMSNTNEPIIPITNYYVSYVYKNQNEKSKYTFIYYILYVCKIQNQRFTDTCNYYVCKSPIHPT